jgi:hypothetical protein
MSFSERDELRLNKLRQELQQLVARRDRARRRGRGRRRSERSPGRPAIDPKILEMAKDLAQVAPIADVALKLDVAKSTLYNHGVSRKMVGPLKTSSAAA